MSAEIDKQDWIEAGLKELAGSGVGGVRVEVLAQRLGVTKGGFYRRFKDRRALLKAVLGEWARGRISAINKLWEQTEDQAPRERLSSVARHYTERLSVQGMAIELAIRQWARTDSAAVKGAGDPSLLVPIWAKPAFCRIRTAQVREYNRCWHRAADGTSFRNRNAERNPATFCWSRVKVCFWHRADIAIALNVRFWG